jgi:hypothetical protein
MSWTWQSICSACALVSANIGFHTPCPYHAGRWSGSPPETNPSEPVTSTLPTADRTWPFTPMEYARLLMLRSRVRAQFH